MRFILVCAAIFLSGCASGISIPSCEVKAGEWASPCVGYSNGPKLSPLREPMIKEGAPYYPAVLYTDESGAYRAMRVYP